MSSSTNSNSNDNEETPSKQKPTLSTMQVCSALRGNLENMRKAVTCPICVFCFKDPVVLAGCMHGYCADCLKKHIESTAKERGKFCCSVCKTPATRRSTQTAPQLAALVTSYKTTARAFGLAPGRYDPRLSMMTQQEPSDVSNSISNSNSPNAEDSESDASSDIDDREETNKENSTSTTTTRSPQEQNKAAKSLSTAAATVAAARDQHDASRTFARALEQKPSGNKNATNDKNRHHHQQQEQSYRYLEKEQRAIVASNAQYVLDTQQDLFRKQQQQQKSKATPNSKPHSQHEQHHANLESAAAEAEVAFDALDPPPQYSIVDMLRMSDLALADSNVAAAAFYSLHHLDVGTLLDAIVADVTNAYLASTDDHSPVDISEAASVSTHDLPTISSDVGKLLDACLAEQLAMIPKDAYHSLVADSAASSSILIQAPDCFNEDNDHRLLAADAAAAPLTRFQTPATDAAAASSTRFQAPDCFNEEDDDDHLLAADATAASLTRFQTPECCKEDNDDRPLAADAAAASSTRKLRSHSRLSTYEKYFPKSLGDSLRADGFAIDPESTTQSLSQFSAPQPPPKRQGLKKRPCQKRKSFFVSAARVALGVPSSNTPQSNLQMQLPLKTLTLFKAMTTDELCIRSDATYTKRIVTAMGEGLISVCTTRLSANQDRSLKDLCQILKKSGSNVQLVVSESLDGTNALLCLIPCGRSRVGGLMTEGRSIKAMQASLLGVPLVSTAWIDACIKQKRIVVPETGMYARTLRNRTTTVCDFGVAFSAAVADEWKRQYRTRYEPFHNYTFYLVGVSSVNESAVAKLVHDAGVQETNICVTEQVSISKLHDICSGKGDTKTKMVVLCDSKSDVGLTEAFESMIRSVMPRVLVVNSEWLYDSISCGYALDSTPEVYKPLGESKTQAL